MLDGKAAPGSMVMLVPATLGDPQSVTVTRRDQSNTDGSFILNDVIPGRYILIAIDRGWRMNWSDASTLSRYLLHGVPVELTATSHERVHLEAQLP